MTTMATTATIDPNITMQELLHSFSRGTARPVPQISHWRLQQLAGSSPTETLAQVCERNDGLPVDEVIDHIQASHEADLKMQIAPEELDTELKSGSAVLLVDVRTREEFEAVHIAGSVLLSQELMQEGLMKWDRKGLMVLIDHQGTRSMDAAAYFFRSWF